ncbi:hypothetical protein GCM10010116_30560 [Microbispora rosea subsp. aerata]|nr:hypothetical protein [Microbispora rosea]GGO15232.1 hypothetical protein GCM10010116_30560 [Microbispora rosea subsp. aerata]GIH57538.1 hypothetical protein Mro02_44520 [Microbispora rosea subsp. aerata]GLJ85508.1 hypothetical protein GCM10017588_42410 [Microbispora rosea subsp. aerata]
MDDQWMRRVWPPAEEETPPSEEAPTRLHGAPGGTPSPPQWPTRPYGSQEADEESFTRAYRLSDDATEDRSARPGSAQGGLATRPYHLSDDAIEDGPARSGTAQSGFAARPYLMPSLMQDGGGVGQERPGRAEGAGEEASGRSGLAQEDFPTRPYLMPDFMRDGGAAGPEGGQRPGRSEGVGEGFSPVYHLPVGEVTPEEPGHSGAKDTGEGSTRAYRQPGEERPDGVVWSRSEGIESGPTRPYRRPGDVTPEEEPARSGSAGTSRPYRQPGDKTQEGGAFSHPYGVPASERRSTARPAWPSLGLEQDKPEEELPPSARRYRAPDTPPRRMPRWLQRLLVGSLALVCSAAVIGAIVVTVLRRAETVPPTVVQDQIAGVTYTLPPQWREGVVAPVTGFTSSAARGDSATVMARPGNRVDPPNLRSAVIDLSDLYTQLLLHGDKVEVLDDRAVTVGGRPGHTRAVRAEYTDVVNEPAFMRVTLLTRPDGGSTVLLGLAQPDGPRSRAEIEGLMWGAR